GRRHRTSSESHSSQTQEVKKLRPGSGDVTRPSPIRAARDRPGTSKPRSRCLFHSARLATKLAGTPCQSASRGSAFTAADVVAARSRSLSGERSGFFDLTRWARCKLKPRAKSKPARELL